MLSTSSEPLLRPGGRRRPAARIRAGQRGLHLVAGLVVAIYIYATPDPGSAATPAVRWVVLPALVASGVAMWQWPRIRRALRRRATRS